MAKKELSEKQKEVLAKNNFKNKPRAVRSELGAKGAKKTNEIKREKIARENSKDYGWEEYGPKWLQYIDEYGDAKTKADVLKALFPNDKQINEVAGSLGVEKIIVLPDELEDINKHIDSVINDGNET